MMELWEACSLGWVKDGVEVSLKNMIMLFGEFLYLVVFSVSILYTRSSSSGGQTPGEDMGTCIYTFWVWRQVKGSA